MRARIESRERNLNDSWKAVRLGTGETPAFLLRLTNISFLPVLNPTRSTGFSISEALVRNVGFFNRYKLPQSRWKADLRHQMTVDVKELFP
jgi:hypothetical protein